MTKSPNALPIFAYGTLQDCEILGAILGRAIAPDAFPIAHLPGFAPLYYPGRVYPALMPRDGARTDGVLLAGLSASERQALDAFEGDEYRREALLVQTASGPVLADCYRPTLPVPPDAPLWSLDHWRRTHKPAHIAREKSLAATARLGAGKPD